MYIGCTGFIDYYHAQLLEPPCVTPLPSKIEIKMATTTFNQTIAEVISKPSSFTLFMKWCNRQRHNRLLWLGLAIAGHGCILTPLAGMAAMLAGANMVLFMLAIAAMAVVLVTNLPHCQPKSLSRFLFLV